MFTGEKNPFAVGSHRIQSSMCWSSHDADPDSVYAPSYPTANDSPAS